MPSPLETIVQRMIDAGEDEESIASVIQSYKPPAANPNPKKPGMMDTFAGGVLKSIGSGETQSAMMKGGLGYLKGMALAVPKGLAGLASIGKGILTDPGQTISDVGTGLADLPGHMVKTFREAGSNPMAWGEMLGETTAPMASANVAKMGVNAIPSVTRAAGRGLETVGDFVARHAPVTGMTMPGFGRPRLWGAAERLVGRGMSATGRGIQNVAAKRPKVVDAEIVGEPTPTGPIEGEVVPSGLLSESATTQTGGWGKPAGIDRQLTSKVPFEKDALTVDDNMFTSADPMDSWAQTVLNAEPGPAPMERVWNMPSETPTSIKGFLGPARTPENQLMELMKSLETQPGTSTSRLAPVDDVMSATGSVDDEMFDLVQRMSGGRIQPKPRTPDVTDIDNEINKLISQLEGTRNPQAAINRPIQGTVKPLVEPEWQDVNSYGITSREADDLLGINASGESAASQEAINRIASMKQKGESFVVYDKAGNVRPLIGPDAVDYTPKTGETYGIRNSQGFRVLEDKGGKVPPASKKPAETKPPVSTPGNTYTVPKENITLDIIKGAGSRGFKFMGLDKKGNYKFVKIR